MITRCFGALAGLAVLGACATGPEPCTPEWVEWKSERILSNFSIANYRTINRLKNFSEKLDDDPGPLTLLQVPGMIEDFEDLAQDFEQDAWPALKAAADQCGSVEALLPAFITFLEDEGVGDDVLEWVELIAVLTADT